MTSILITSVRVIQIFQRSFQDVRGLKTGIWVTFDVFYSKNENLEKRGLRNPIFEKNRISKISKLEKSEFGYPSLKTWFIDAMFSRFSLFIIQ
jgi:hypothetical protein